MLLNYSGIIYILLVWPLVVFLSLLKGLKYRSKTISQITGIKRNLYIINSGLILGSIFQVLFLYFLSKKFPVENMSIFIFIYLTTILAAILTAKFPNISQVVCFDTAFHTTCNELTQLFAIPKWLTEEGVRRYGFHGLSYEYIATQLDKYLPAGKASGKIIVMHLGQGASMCGMINHKSYTTSLSFSALDGLPMGTRTGSFDPGAMLYLMEHYKMDHKQLEHLLYKESGLLGVSGESSDMRVLLSSNKPDSKLAIDLFVYRVGAWIGTLAAEMQGIDGLVFTAGIGENAAQPGGAF